MIEWTEPCFHASAMVDWQALASAAWEVLDPSQFEDLFAANPAWAPLIAIGLALFVSLTPLPMETIAIINGMWFGPWLGGLLTWVGALIAALLAFCLAKLIGRPLVERLLPDKAFARMEDVVERHGAPTMIMIRMIPLIPFTVVNYGAGVTHMRWQTFLWTSALGMIPPTIVFVALGDMLMTNPALAFGGLFAVAVASYVVVRFINRRGEASHAASSN